MLRVGFSPPYPDTPGLDIYNLYSPQPNASNQNPKLIAFGSAHPRAGGMVMADGSVRTTDYSIDPAVHQAASSRNDGGAGR